MIIEHPHVVPRQRVPLLYRRGNYAVVETYEGLFPVYWVVRLRDAMDEGPTESEIMEGHAGVVGRKRIFAAAVAACQRIERESYGKD